MYFTHRKKFYFFSKKIIRCKIFFKRNLTMYEKKSYDVYIVPFFQKKSYDVRCERHTMWKPTSYQSDVKNIQKWYDVGNFWKYTMYDAHRIFIFHQIRCEFPCIGFKNSNFWKKILRCDDNISYDVTHLIWIRCAIKKTYDVNILIIRCIDSTSYDLKI